MHASIISPKSRLEDIVGTIVVIDTFRASNTVLSLLENGASSITLIDSIQEAIQLKKSDNELLLLGERNGIQLDGFDGDNSPVGASRYLVREKDIILTTSSFTQVIKRMKSAEKVLVGSFIGADALIEELIKIGSDQIYFLAVGEKAKNPALEDDLAAEYLKALLVRKKMNFESIREKLINCDGAKRLRSLGKDQDIEYCLRLNTHNIVSYISYMQQFPKALLKL